MREGRREKRGRRMEERDGGRGEEERGEEEGRKGD